MRRSRRLRALRCRELWGTGGRGAGSSLTRTSPGWSRRRSRSGWPSRTRASRGSPGSEGGPFVGRWLSRGLLGLGVLLLTCGSGLIAAVFGGSMLGWGVAVAVLGVQLGLAGLFLDFGRPDGLPPE